MEKRWYQRLAPLCFLLALVILFAQPFTVVSAAENTYVIKAGTYRFNDVLSFSTLLEDGTYFYEIIEFTTRGVVSVDQEISDYIEDFGYDLPVGDYIGNVEAGGILLDEYENFSKISYNLTFYCDDLAYFDALYYLLGNGDDVLVYNDTDYWLSSAISNVQTITIPRDSEVTAKFYEWFTANAVCLDLQEGGKTDMGIVESITSVWTAVATWFISTMGLVPSLFYVEETGLTFIGTLAIFGGGLTVIIGIIYAVRSWLKSR